MVKFSIENSVPASRLVAAVSEFQPLDPADTEEARNRTAVLN
jgi:chemotaxis protein MotB